MRRRSVVAVDDLDESAPADDSVDLVLGGTTYRWSLTRENAQDLRDLMGRWIELLSRGEGTQAVHIVFDGKRATLHPTSAQLQDFRAELNPWLSRARKHKRRVVRRVSAPASAE